MNVSNGYTKRIVIRMTPDLYEWLMAQNGAATGREVLERAMLRDKKNQ